MVLVEDQRKESIRTMMQFTSIPDEKEYGTGADQIAGEVARKDIWPDLAEFIED